MKPIDCSTEELRSRTTRRTERTGTEKATPWSRAAGILFGAEIVPLMAHPSAVGRFSGAAVTSPRGACTALMTYPANGASQSYSNEDFIEVFMCLNGSLEIWIG
ncbi:MAG: hypothetical protein Q8N17_02295, partial [Burkholderiaceae bacterium]|nr:hypothetical protein [Burkholderiaceae bacterium]